MIPHMISFVGIDEQTNIDEVEKISGDWWNKAIIEWGILYSPQRAGKEKRYPAFDKIKTFLSGSEFTAFNPSIHLCGSGVDELLDRTNQELIDLLEVSYPRVQLNFAMKNYDAQELEDKILSFIKDYPDTTFILQHNKSKAKFCKSIIQTSAAVFGDGEGGIDFLYDGSGGFGRELENPETPIPGFFTGYAGGIGPESVERIVKRIEKVVGNDAYYIDMESKIRTEDWLDLDKCRSVLETVWKMKDADSAIFG